MNQSNDVRKLDSIRALKKLMLEHGVNAGNKDIHIDYLVEELTGLLEQSNREASEESVRACARWRGEWRELDEQEFINAALGEIYPEYGETPELQHPEGRET